MQIDREPAKRFNSPDAPAPYGPYVHAVVRGDWIFLAGQNGRDPATRALVQGGIRAQTERAIRNLEAVLKDLGCQLSDIVKTTVYLNDMDDFEAMNEIYRTLFGPNVPARSTVQVRLPFDALVAVDAIAVKPARDRE